MTIDLCAQCGITKSLILDCEIALTQQMIMQETSLTIGQRMSMLIYVKGVRARELRPCGTCQVMVPTYVLERNNNLCIGCAVHTYTNKRLGG